MEWVNLSFLDSNVEASNVVFTNVCIASLDDLWFCRRVN